MNVRELLQYELWSKETSQRLGAKIWKFSKRLAVVLGILASVIVIVAVVESHWLTAGERKTGRAALAQVDELRGLIDCKCERFIEVDKKAKESVAVAVQRAWTKRDHWTSFELSFYLGQVETIPKDDLREDQVKQVIEQRHLPLHSDPAFEAEVRDSRIRYLELLSSILHKVLD
jgi:hypothetical protein